jgi:hypothetical protein
MSFFPTGRLLSYVKYLKVLRVTYVSRQTYLVFIPKMGLESTLSVVDYPKKDTFISTSASPGGGYQLKQCGEREEDTSRYVYIKNVKGNGLQGKTSGKLKVQW